MAALTATIKELGGKPVKAPGVDFGEAFSSQDTFLKTAQTFEDLGVGAYNGAGPMIKSTDVLVSAGSIVQVEGRHAGVIRLLRGEPIAPSAFDKGLDEQEVLDAAQAVHQVLATLSTVSAGSPSAPSPGRQAARPFSYPAIRYH